MPRSRLLLQLRPSTTTTTTTTASPPFIYYTRLSYHKYWGLVSWLLFLLLLSQSCYTILSATTTTPSSPNSSSSSSSGSMLPMMAAAADAINNVAVVGGTHGNEYTGVFCVKALERQLQNNNNNNNNNIADTNKYPFQLSTIIGNPTAHLQNKRFIDNDLNRQFSYEALASAKSASIKTVEQARALELNDLLLGPKQFHEDNINNNNNTDNIESTTTTIATTTTTTPTLLKPKMDLIIDLHTTTANMGVTIIVGQHDVLTTQCAAYILKHCPFTTRILMHTHNHQRERPHVSSIARHAFTIEVGAVPQGVVRHDKVEEMQSALLLTLEFLQRVKQGEQAQVQEELLSHFGGHFGSDGKSGTVAIPCYRSAPAIHAGEMSAKLQWPSADDNPNFPLWVVHKSIQDRDFAQIETGDPLFVDLDGNVIPYDGAYGSPITLMFINEGGYYYGSSGTGISVAKEDAFDLLTGELVSTRKMTTATMSTTAASTNGGGGDSATKRSNNVKSEL